MNDWLMSVVVVLAMIGFILMVGNLAFWVQRAAYRRRYGGDDE